MYRNSVRMESELLKGGALTRSVRLYNFTVNPNSLLKTTLDMKCSPDLTISSYYPRGIFQINFLRNSQQRNEILKLSKKDSQLCSLINEHYVRKGEDDQDICILLRFWSSSSTWAACTWKVLTGTKNCIKDCS